MNTYFSLKRHHLLYYSFTNIFTLDIFGWFQLIFYNLPKRNAFKWSSEYYVVKVDTRHTIGVIRYSVGKDLRFFKK